MPFGYHPHPLLLPTLSSKRPLIYFLPLQIFLFWTFHMNEIVQYVTFCDRLLLLNTSSRFIHEVAHISISFLFMVE